ncbi:phage tail protein [Acerihabitans sp. TG2]|uniref:phage tail-collar fiber domain-containing protein n=1 Tax=Acerihabitans sp. TG2 TaxID=3096008 RepID=UPI002B239967|nr:phage tail protein [Acerihabitans sp. TG2]MEA9389566.1 phage tail protein [Acerihabitans sp. TG2]
MTTKYYALLTNLGAAKLANATALGTQLKLTHLAVGDGGGTLPTPDPAQTQLIGEQRRSPLNSLSVDAANTNQIIAEQIIPENEGGFWIREIGLFDNDGILIAIANCPDTYKPLLQEGSGRTQTVRLILIVSNTEAVTLKIDPSVVLATRKYVDDKVIEVKAYADELMARHLAAADPHPQYAQKASPTLTGTPKAPTATKGDNTTQIATTAFVQAALTALLDGAPGALDTLNELAAALGDDPTFSTTVLDAIAGKLAKEQNGADIPDKALFLQNIGISHNLIPVGIPLPWPTATPPSGWLKCNGAVFNKTTYPLLAAIYPTGILPDLRGEFIRGFDDARGVDAGRSLLSLQLDVLQQHGHGPIRLSGIGSGGGNLAVPDGGSSLSGDGNLVGAVSNTAYNGSSPRTGAETRPRNVAFNYIVRAA